MVPVESLPDAVGTALRVGDAVTAAWWNVHYAPILLPATVTKLRTVEGRPSLMVDPTAESEPLVGGVPATPGRVLNARPHLVVAHATTGALEGVLDHRDAHGRVVTAGDRVGFVFTGEHRLYAWARGTVESEQGDHLLVVPDANWQLEGYPQRVTAGHRDLWWSQLLVRLGS